jgi:hypothetical protein
VIDRIFVEEYPRPRESQSSDVGYGHFTNDLHESAEQRLFRRDNPWWPCQSRAEFQILSVLHRLNLSESQLNELLKTDFVSLACRMCIIAEANRITRLR